MNFYQSSCSSQSYNKIWFGDCNNNYSTSSDNVVTYYPTLTPTPLAKVGPPNGGGYCDCSAPFDTVDTGSNWNSAFFGGEETWLGNPQDMLALQTFAAGATESFSKCQNIGRKAVASKRQWHGTFGFISNDICALSRSIAPDQTKYLSKGISLAGSAYSTDLRPGGGSWTAGYSGTGTVYINGNTGIMAVDGELNESATVVSGTLGIYAKAHYRTLDGSENSSSGNWTSGVGDGTSFDNWFIAAATNGGFCLNLDGTVDVDASEIGFEGITTSPFGLVNVTDPASYGATASLDGWSGTFLITGSFFAAGGPTYIITYTAEVSRNNTGYSATYSYTNNSYDNSYEAGTLFGENGATVTLQINLSVPNTALDIMTNCESLLGYWDLTDDVEIPWRYTDDYTAFMPLVMAREVQTNVPPNFFAYNMPDETSPIYDSSGSVIGYNTTAWLDPNSFQWVYPSGSVVATGMISANYDGTIIGNPIVNGVAGLPTGGKRCIGHNWFDFYYTDIRFCPQPGGGDCFGPSWEEYPYAFGASLADAVVSVSGIEDGGQFSNFLPMCSTHFVNNVQAHNISRGGMQSCGIADSGIWAVKYAETRSPAPHINYFRPCGDDRVLIDETTAKNFTLANTLIMDGTLVGLIPDSIILVHNGTNDGIYNNSSQTDNGDGTWTLVLDTGSLLAPLPTNYTRPFTGTNEVGFVRFPNAPGICGRVGISVISSGSTGVIVNFNDKQTNLRTNDLIDLYDANNVLLFGSRSVTYLNDNNFYLSQSYSGSISSSAFAQSTGTPDYHWNDAMQKYEYRWGRWNTSLRDPSFSNSSSCQQNCLNYTPCREQVVCYSPNGEDFINGNTIWFVSASFQGDGAFGNYNQLNAEFVMTDIFYQPPLPPLVSDITDDMVYATIHPEDGTCPNDSANPDTGVPILYYQIPRVEAVCSVPSGSPALPSDITIPPMNQPPLPGVIGYSYSVTQQPTTYYYNTTQHCTSSCRFKYYNC